VVAGVCHTFGFIDGPARSGAVFAGLGSIAVYGNTLYVIDNGVVRKVDALGVVSSLVQPPNYSTQQSFRGIEISRAQMGEGPIFVADELEKKIKSIDEGGAICNIR